MLLEPVRSEFEKLLQDLDERQSRCRDFLDDELLERQLGVADAEQRTRFLGWVEGMQHPGAPATG